MTMSTYEKHAILDTNRGLCIQTFKDQKALAEQALRNCHFLFDTEDEHVAWIKSLGEDFEKALIAQRAAEKRCNEWRAAFKARCVEHGVSERIAESWLNMREDGWELDYDPVKAADESVAEDQKDVP